MSAHVFNRPPGVPALMLRALLTGFRRPGRVDALVPAGRVIPSLRIDGDHLSRYVSLCGFASDAQGRVPITYPQVLAFPLVLDYLVSPQCPWSAIGMVHLANRIQQISPIRVGEALAVEVTPGSLLAHPRGQVFTLEIRVLRDGVRVWEATQTLLRRGVAHPAGEPFEIQAPLAPALHETATIDVPADIGRRYARVSSDFNPIHLSALTARFSGFRRAIAHGLWTQARAVALLEPHAGSRPAELSTLFMSPLMLPARATLWTAGDADHRRFELRDERGERIHFRSDWACARS